MTSSKNCIIHILVIGFHHKKGCQVEFVYPSLANGSNPESKELPELWKHLPSLALPDGSHNYDQDTIFFHLPSLENPRHTVFGISCFRQINAESLLRRSSDVTRSTVQKSVCVLSRHPVYGLIQTKLEVVTQAYFAERDFSQVSLLTDTFATLNAALADPYLLSTNLYLGLSVRDFITRFRHKALVLFKLLLLEKKVLFFKSPVKSLCTSILTLCSLFPGMMEYGLKEAGSIVTNQRKLIEVRSSNDHEYLEVVYTPSPNSNGQPLKTNIPPAPPLPPPSQELEVSSVPPAPPLPANCLLATTKEQLVSNCATNAASVELSEEDSLLLEIETLLSSNSKKSLTNASDTPQQCSPEKVPHKVCSTSSFSEGEELEDFGLPLSLFTKGSVCHPYLSLPFLDLLSDINLRSFVVGATNVLFQQKSYLFDVIVDMETGQIDVADGDLRRQLHLSTEDLRFADHLVRHVTAGTSDLSDSSSVDGSHSADGIGWEGSDDWLRAQFKLYLLSLMKVSTMDTPSKDNEAFNSNFITSWKATHNYKMWSARSHKGLHQVFPSHPFQGHLSVSDMKLRISHSIQTSERGRKLNQAMQNTGRAVGGALVSAKSAVSSWWTHFSVTPQDQSPPSSSSEVS